MSLEELLKDIIKTQEHILVTIEIMTSNTMELHKRIVELEEKENKAKMR